MIIDHISEFKNYVSLNPHYKKVKDFLKKNDIYTLECGRYEIDGDNAFANIVERELQKADDPLWEAHDEYIDIHLILEGSEIVMNTYLGEERNDSQYDEEHDCRLYRELNGVQAELTKGMFCLVLPHDIHSPNHPSTGSFSKKMIVKIRVR